MKPVGSIGVGIAYLLLSAAVQLSAVAQQPSIFGGKGIRSADEADGNSATGMQWPKLHDFSTNKSADEDRWRLFGSKRDSFWKADVADDATEQPRLFGGMPTLFPKRNPEEPNLLQRMNDRSKSFLDRTTDWAQEKNQNFRDRTYQSWDSLTKNLRPSQPDSDVDSMSDSQHAAPPPVRTAENPDGRPSVRF